MAHVLFTALLGAQFLFTLAAAQSDCPDIPDTGVEIGQPVPIVPGDIPPGCSDFEILVTRGTSEPSFRKFGVIVGDPVVSNVSKILPGARGYPVQVRSASIMHRAADQIPTSIFPNIKSVVMFGDPNLRLDRLGDQFPDPLRAKLLQNCAGGDPVSSHTSGSI
ncbi:hypothetical protein CC78DRAFT_556265 [Lojkania enalia]|uniref:Uncharacterized protein n=1 Tax=Lojkania enalia TaxID=147567 RepID=A0A9P4JXZ5_9PLEO|nr:hypothetical protein CC78DRAFT_556265 [Didymosphaeria enalia]